MNRQFHTPAGVIERTLTLSEVKEEAENGNREAIRELVDMKGGYDALNPGQEKKVVKMLLGYKVSL